MPENALRPTLPKTGRDAVMRLPETVCDIYLALMASVFLLYLHPAEGLGNTSGAKREAFYVLTGAFLIALLVSALCLLNGDRTHDAFAEEMRLRLRKPSLALWALLAYLGLTVISAALSTHQDVVWLGGSRNENVLTQTLYVLLFAALLLFARPKPWLVGVLGGTIVLEAILAAIQVTGANPLHLYPGEHDYFTLQTHFLTTIGNVDYVGAFLCMAIPVQVVFLIRSDAKWRLVLLLSLSASLFLLLTIFVLGAFVGLFVGCVISLPYVLRFSKKLTRGYFIAVAIAAVIGLIALYAVDLGDGMFHEMHEILHGNFDDKFGSSRIYIWRRVLVRIPERPLFGFGPDTMGVEGIERFSRFDEEKQKWVYAEITAAHNEYMNILFHHGVFALAAYLTAVGTAVAHFFRYGKRVTVVAVCGAAFLCYLAEAFFGISNLIISPSFWIPFALLEGAAARVRVQEYRQREDALESAVWDAAEPEEGAAAPDEASEPESAPDENTVEPSPEVG